MGLGVRRRLTYLGERVRAVDLPRLWRTSGQIARSARRARVGIFFDMLFSAVQYEMAFQDYQDWDFHLLTRAERATFMSHPKSNHLAQKLNHPEHRSRFADKSNFNREFSAYLGRDWIDVRDASPQELAAFVAEHGAVMAKVPDSLGGQGIARVEAADVSDFEQFHSELLAGRQFLVEQVIPQHPEMSRLYSGSVNTLRVISFFDGSDVHIIAAALRIGNGGAVDNFSHGGMYTMLDERGVALYPAFDGENQTYGIHPATGVPIVGFPVPEYAQVIELVDRIARVVPEIPYVGWDIAISPDGPVVIEGNYNTGVFQAKPSVSGVRTGLLPRYREVIGF